MPSDELHCGFREPGLGCRCGHGSFGVIWGYRRYIGMMGNQMENTMDNDMETTRL